MADVRVPEVELPTAEAGEESIGDMRDKIIQRFRRFMGRKGFAAEEAQMVSSGTEQMPPEPMGAAPGQEELAGELGAPPGQPGVMTNLDASRLALEDQQRARAASANQGQETV